jgi:hypothetical protein
MNPSTAVYARNDRSLWIKDAVICLYPEKKIPTISAKESALIPLARYQIYKICRTKIKC